MDRWDAERLCELFHNRLPTEDQLESLLRLLSDYDGAILPKLINMPVMKYAHQTSVHLAAKGGSYHCLEILLKHGGKASYSGVRMCLAIAAGKQCHIVVMLNFHFQR